MPPPTPPPLVNGVPLLEAAQALHDLRTDDHDSDEEGPVGVRVQRGVVDEDERWERIAKQQRAEVEEGLRQMRERAERGEPLAPDVDEADGDDDEEYPDLMNPLEGASLDTDLHLSHTPPQKLGLARRRKAEGAAAFGAGDWAAARAKFLAALAPLKFEYDFSESTACMAEWLRRATGARP